MGSSPSEPLCSPAVCHKKGLSSSSKPIASGQTSTISPFSTHRTIKIAEALDQQTSSVHNEDPGEMFFPEMSTSLDENAHVFSTSYPF